MASYGNIIYDPATGNITSIGNVAQTKGKVVQAVSASGPPLAAVVGTNLEAPHSTTNIVSSQAQTLATMQARYPDWTPPNAWVMPAALAALAYFLFFRD